MTTKIVENYGYKVFPCNDGYGSYKVLTFTNCRNGFDNADMCISLANKTYKTEKAAVKAAEKFLAVNL